MCGSYGFSTTREGQIFIAINFAILAIALLYEHWQEQLEEKQRKNRCKPNV